MNRLWEITVPVQRTFNLPTLAMVEMVAGDRGWGPINLGLDSHGKLGRDGIVCGGVGVEEERKKKGLEGRNIEEHCSSKAQRGDELELGWRPWGAKEVWLEEM